MAPAWRLFLSIIILTLPPVLPGADADAVSTVSNVAVQSGRSVTIPCHYDRKYEKHVKYWCWGKNWNFCRIVVRTDSPKVKGETSITDDPDNHVFTVTMAKLKTEDSGYYWCAVEIRNNLTPDKRKYLYLSVTAGTPGLWVDQQEVTGVEGGCVSVQCHYNESSSMKKWCRAEGSCVEVNSNKSERAEIKDDLFKNVFNVTMRELNREDAGWYWCAAGELQIPVHINVTEETTTPTVTRLVLMTSEALLLLVVAVAVVIWRLWKKHGESAQANARAREGGTNELTTVHPEEEVTYSTVLCQSCTAQSSCKIHSRGQPRD
ncbi:polymeric immunoglobulin receptor-like [Anguilla anguilla]|uniref:polymeric immunoglobulin receptor-like n=1 Tax=Anguilla anguilla TaxID=7936 RepID=UPI0015AC5264|nr:polymeric immunoglobulin receptor-like [Anguilla anguilla]